MPRNTLSDLNNHLFMQLERLNEEDLEGEKLQEEIARAKAVSNLAAQIINNGSLVLRAHEFVQEYGLNDKKRKFPPMLRGEFLED